MSNLTFVTINGDIGKQYVDTFDLAYIRLTETKNVETVDAAFDTSAGTYSYLVGIAESELGVEHTVGECVAILKRIGLKRPKADKARQLVSA